MLLTKMKKILMLIGATMILVSSNAIAATAIGDAGSSSSGASGGATPVVDQAAGGLLQQIATNTNNILIAINNLPTTFQQVIAAATSWLSTPPDSNANPDPTSVLQNDFASLASAVLTTNTAQNTVQSKLTTDLLGQNTTIPYANDLLYSTMLGPNYLYLNPDPRNKGGKITVDPGYNYLKNAAGLNIPHVIPGVAPAWRGNPGDVTKYNSFYQTIMAAQSFNAYALSNLYADYSNGNSLTQLQTQLLTDASDSVKWFKYVSAEPLGIVLRQILMFESQTYVLISRMLEVQKQLLTSQVMTNSLLILLNQPNETQLVQRALKPSPV